jgi:S-adenosylmethionine-diacylglycerol 3-amino-3-carboxypropyl transferase
MSEAATGAVTRKLIASAVNNSRLLSREGLAERAFTLAFSNLVYPQIWEDPIVDMEALQLQPTSRVVSIASGGCNLLSYLTASPESILAVDLNRAHIALNRLKLAAARHLDSYEEFFRFFGEADKRENIDVFDRKIAPHLDAETLEYWRGRDWRRRRRITGFADNFYRKGLLGRFIGAGHLMARAHGVKINSIMQAGSLEEQRHIFQRDLAPLFDRRLVRWLIGRPESLYGLGIPPAQYRALAGDHADGIAGVLRQRLERLACDFPLSENYFARQAFGRSYGGPDAGSLPPYLERENYALLRRNVDRASVRHVGMTDYLAEQPDASLDRYILLDAQDWMCDDKLNRLWREIGRTAREGARVIFRTSASPSLLPGRVADELLARWTYEEELSKELGTKDRSAIYGGFHLYTLQGAAQ